jgi:hypothetical protein
MSARQLIAVVRRSDCQRGLGFGQIVGLHGFRKWNFDAAGLGLSHESTSGHVGAGRASAESSAGGF